MKEILYPVVALAGLTFIVLLIIPYVRFKAGFAGRVKVKDFRYGESASVPADVSLPNRNLMNLLEMPVLFYVVCLAFYFTGTTEAAALWLAWTYVALRAGHSLVHLTYNNVYHRLAVYGASNVVLLVLWVRFALALK
jgi:hypothetical protein